MKCVFIWPLQGELLYSGELWRRYQCVLDCVTPLLLFCLLLQRGDVLMTLPRQPISSTSAGLDSVPCCQTGWHGWPSKQRYTHAHVGTHTRVSLYSECCNSPLLLTVSSKERTTLTSLTPFSRNGWELVDASIVKKKIDLKNILKVINQYQMSYLIKYMNMLSWVSGLIHICCVCGRYFLSEYLCPLAGAGLLQFIWAVWTGCGKQWELAQGPVTSSIGPRTAQSTARAMPGMLCVRDVCVWSFVGCCCVHLKPSLFYFWFLLYFRLVLFPFPCICLSQQCSVSMSDWCFSFFSIYWKQALERHLSWNQKFLNYNWQAALQKQRWYNTKGRRE